MNEGRGRITDLTPGYVPDGSETKLRSGLMTLLGERMTRRDVLKAGGLAGLSLSALWALACQPRGPEAPKAAATPKIGRQLIGKLEGPTVITDPAKTPKAFKEAPMLADLVKAGKLPPVKERVSEEPLVVKPLRDIGKYGGTWRRGFTGPADTSAGDRVNESDHLTYFDYTATKVIPFVGKGWEVSDGGKTLTFFLRKGMRWSDGAPFTADDIMFWYEDMYQNKDLVPTPSAFLATKGVQGKIEKVDTYTVRYKFSHPYYALPTIYAGQYDVMGQHKLGRLGMGGLAPAHYLKKFLPKYVSKDELDKKVKDLKFDNWVTLIKNQNDWARNPELPVLMAWKSATPITTPNWVLERNPYCWQVDTEGNQLPYIDKMSMTLGENLEIINLRAIAGEYDHQERHTDLMKLPVFLENQQRGNYTVHLDPAIGETPGMVINMSYEGDPEVVKWINNADFRRALSLGIERDQLNETFFLGTGVAGSLAPSEQTVYTPGPEYRKLWSTYDPKKANEMLDKIGLTKKDAEGFRLRTDGKGRLRIEVATYVGFLQATQMMEMVREQWKKIGIQADVTELERNLAYKRRDANENVILVDMAWGAENIFAHPQGTVFPVDGTSAAGPVYGKWFGSGGTQGKEPPPRMRELLEKYREAMGAPDKEHVQLGKDIWKIICEEVWTIPTVGLSPVTMGVRIVKNTMGNIPERTSNGAAAHSPGNNLTQTYYFKT